MKRKFRIYASLHDDINEGHVWLKDDTLRPRSVVRLRFAGKTIRCEVLQIENNFLRTYNKPPRITISDPGSALVINGWYRAKLGGLETRRDYEVEVNPSDNPWGRLRAAMQHPQLAMRVAVCLGVIGILVGAAGVKPWEWFVEPVTDGRMEWRGFVHSQDPRASTSRPITADQLENAPRFQLLLDCAAWGRSILSEEITSFECAVGCMVRSGPDDVVCRDSTWMTR